MVYHNLSLKKELEGETKLQKNTNLNTDTFNPSPSSIYTNPCQSRHG